MKTLDELMQASNYCVVSTVDEHGDPWAAPVFFVRDDERVLYWWSDTEAQHSRNIEETGKAYITIFDSTATEGKGQGLYLKSEAGRVPNGKIARILELYNSKVSTFVLQEDDVTGSAPTRLFQAVPQKFWRNADGSRNGKYVDIREELA